MQEKQQASDEAGGTQTQAVPQDEMAELNAPPSPRHFAVTVPVRLALAAPLGAMVSLCFPPYGWAILLPFGVAALLALLRNLSPRLAFYLGFLYGMGLFATACSWFRDLFGSAAVSLWAIAALFPALTCALIVWLSRRLHRVSFSLLAPVVWVGVEYFRSEPMTPNFAWLGLGYAEVGTYSMASSLASLFGSYGVTFFIVLIGARFASSTGLSARIFFAVLWLSFAAPKQRFLPPEKPISVRLIQAFSEDEEALFRLSETGEVRPDLILWPEYSFVSDPRRDARLWRKLQELPRRTGTYLLFGAKDVFDTNDDHAFRNSAWLLDPQGEIVHAHVKNHTIHFLNDGIAGHEARAVDTLLGRLGVAICFDLDFPDVARKLVQDGAEILLVPSNNPLEWGDLQRAQHRQLFQMRAIETGRWIATSDVAGNTALIDPGGRERAALHRRDEGVLTVQAGRSQVKTLYVRGGWIFGTACLVLMLVLCLWASIPRRATPV